MKKQEKPLKVNMTDQDLLKLMVNTKPLKKDQKAKLPKGLNDVRKQLRGK